MKNEKTGQCECRTPVGSGDNFCDQCGGRHNLPGIPDFYRSPLYVVKSTEGLVCSDEGVKTYVEVDNGEKIQYIGKTMPKVKAPKPEFVPPNEVGTIKTDRRL